jgi:hypothetical protein
MKEKAGEKVVDVRISKLVTLTSVREKVTPAVKEEPAEHEFLWNNSVTMTSVREVRPAEESPEDEEPVDPMDFLDPSVGLEVGHYSPAYLRAILAIHKDPGQPAKGPGKKTKRDPLAPKMPPSSYFLFSGAQRAEVVRSLPHLKPKEVSAELGRRWGGLGEADRAAYTDMAAERRANYKVAMLEYRRKGGAAKTKVEVKSGKRRRYSSGLPLPKPHHKLSSHVGGVEESLPPGWKAALGPGGLPAVVSPAGAAFPSRTAAYRALLTREGSAGQGAAAMRPKLQYEGWSAHPALPPGWLARVAEQAPGSSRRWGVFLTAEGAVLPARLAHRAAERMAGPEGERRRFQALCALGPAALARALVDLPGRQDVNAVFALFKLHSGDVDGGKESHGLVPG